jgi:hypothetical protein
MRSKLNNKILFIIVLGYVLIADGLASENDTLIFTNHIFSDKIKTVLLNKEGWNLSYPVMKLGTNDKLILQFDLLSKSPENYYYTFIHCDRNWKKSDIFTNDYLDGIPENQIENYKSSFNTTVPYYHYKLTFPNERINIKYSGNYIIEVYPIGEPEKPVLTRRFMVTEDAVRITATLQRPQMALNYNTGQQIDFTVNYTGLNVTDPHRDISSSVLKNGQWSTAKRNIQPDIISYNELKYSSLSENNVFPGGNEYRYFDIRSIRLLTEYVRKIDFNNNYYHVFLSPSENREFKPYFYWQDFNGKYYIAVQEGRDMDIEADYVWVYFTMPATYKATGGNVYVSGALSDWGFGNGNIMSYDPEKAEYQCSMLLKQGWYNFEYIFLKNSDKTAWPSLFEGNHYETENDYLLLVYFRNQRERYDKLAGSLILNTTKKNQN